MEVERKFKFDKVPDNLELLEIAEVYQAYLSINPEVRLREKVKHDMIDYKLTIKGDGTLTRTEVELGISRLEYLELLDIIGHKGFIKKHYTKYRLPDGHILECSIVDEGTETEFRYAEIEFESEDEARIFKVPDYLGDEITYDDSYKMKNYWKRTRLEVV